MAESIDALPIARGQRRRAGPTPRAAPKLAVPAAPDCPRWLLDALARRGIEPSAERPVHRLLRECDLPTDVEEREKVPVGGEHHALERELEGALLLRYRDRPEVLVSGDTFVYFDGPDATLATADCLAPDLMVAFGVPKRLRRNYVVWQEKKAPDFVLEFLSPSTKRRDVAAKPALYRRMGVREYFLFDADRRTEPRLAGWRFVAGERLALPLVPVAGGMRGIYSETLGLHLCHTQPWPPDSNPAGRLLRWHDPVTDGFLETLIEQARRTDAAERQRDEQASRTDAAERQRDEEAGRAEAAERGRHAAERQRDEEASRAEAAERRAAAEAAARRALEEKVAALEARLRRQSGG